MFSLEQYQAVRERAALIDRSDDRGRLRLTGNDRRTYLHGLLTNDIAALTAQQGCYAVLLTPQGRMISDMRVSELGEAVLIDLPGHTAETVRQRLSDFIFSEDVEVVDVRQSLAHFGLYGPSAVEMLTPMILRPEPHREDLSVPGQGIEELPPNANLTARFEDTEIIVVRSDDYGVDGFELFIAAPESDRLADRLRAAGAADVSAETLAVCRIEAGRPEFGVDMDEHTIPLEAGIEDRAISLTKGCYVGQEIIIRVLHRGHGRVAKRLVGFVGAAQDPPFVRGEPLLSTEGKEVGAVTSGAASPRFRRPIGLGYVHRDFADAGTVLQVGPVDAGPRQATVVTVPFIQPATAQ